MDQTVINWALTGFGGLIGFFLKIVWDAVKDLQAADRTLAEKVSNIEVLVAGNYVKKEEFDRIVTRIFEKLDLIVEQVSGKADR